MLLKLAAVALFCATAFTPSLAQTVFVSSENDDSVNVFDAQGQSLKTFATCLRPRHMALTRDQQRLLVLCGNSNLLAELDPKTGQLLDQTPVGNSPEIFALSPDEDTVYVSIEDDGVMAAYSRSQKKQLFEIATGEEPEGVLVTPDGQTAYVTSEEDEVVHVIDLAQRKVLRDIPVGERPRRFMLHAQAKELWVTNELSASVSIIDTEAMAVKDTLNFSIQGVRQNRITPVGIVMSRDGKSAWVALGQASHIAQVDLASKKVLKTVLVGKRPWGLALSPDGQTLYVTNGLSDDMTLVDTASGKALRSVPTGRVPHTPLVMP
jgi:PQQ-dependent catabolism-associated beta-propeller protein